MVIYACDICKKKIKDRNQVMDFSYDLNRASLCDKCSKPLMAFLKKNGLIKARTSSIWGKPKKQ